MSLRRGRFDIQCLNGYIRDTMTIQEILPRRLQARELIGNYWFNGGPVFLSELHGQPVLVDFWDYACSASLRALPYVNEWHRRYRDSGLVVVGVHTPKFHFGREPENVSKAIERLGIEYPVVMDNAEMIWANYGNRAWPTKYLVDRDGYVRCQNIGEGNYRSFERSLQFLLHDANPSEELPDLMDPLRETDMPGAVCYHATPEVFGGYVRGSLGNVDGYTPESAVAYEDPGYYVNGRFYLQGVWRAERECVRWLGTSGETGILSMPYSGSALNVVIAPPEHATTLVTVEQDGTPLTRESGGEDIVLLPDGRSVLNVDMPRLFSVVKNPEFGEHVFRLKPEMPGTSVYSLTGVTAVIPDVFGKN
jgi:thiol-disulfide isomerase/thioredoxin